LRNLPYLHVLNLNLETLERRQLIHDLLDSLLWILAWFNWNG